jgi:hypothetical protein
MKYTDLQKEIIKVLIGEQGLPNLPKSMKEPGDDDTPKKPKVLEPNSEPKAEPAKAAAPHDTTYSDNIDTKVNVPKDRGLIPKDTVPRETGEVRFKPPSDMKAPPKVIDIPTVNRGGYNKEFNPNKFKRYI